MIMTFVFFFDVDDDDLEATNFLHFWFVCRNQERNLTTFWKIEMF